ncbi:MAG TPA: iron-containing alcohol dehydrogenase [Fastidiosipila sp.]|nr:iron-containing alcohol dehydrogenase [Fastidiosipila sp.]
MLDFTFHSPTFFEFGRNAEDQTGKLAKRFGAKKVMLHYGQQSVIKSGLLDRVEKSLHDEGIETVRLGGVVPNPEASKVYEGIELGRKENIDMIIGVGGGSAVDSAKAIAVGIPYDGDFWDFYDKGQRAEAALPVGCVLTLAATGTEGSDSTVITNVEDDRKKRGYGSHFMRPVFSVLNPELQFTLPPYQTACGIVDMIAHVLERYLSNTPDVELTDRMSEAVIKTIINQGRIAVKEPDNYEARAALLWGGMVAHNNLLGVGREQDWSSHQIEHELSAIYGVAHGAGLAVVFPAFMTFTLEHGLERYAQFAHRVFDVEADFMNPRAVAEEGIRRFKAFLTEIGMPTTFAELGAKEEDIPMLAKRVKFNTEDTLGFFQPLSRKDVEAIFRLAL